MYSISDSQGIHNEHNWRGRFHNSEIGYHSPHFLETCIDGAEAETRDINAHRAIPLSVGPAYPNTSAVEDLAARKTAKDVYLCEGLHIDDTGGSKPTSCSNCDGSTYVSAKEAFSTSKDSTPRPSAEDYREHDWAHGTMLDSNGAPNDINPSHSSNTHYHSTFSVHQEVTRTPGRDVAVGGSRWNTYVERGRNFVHHIGLLPSLSSSAISGPSHGSQSTTSESHTSHTPSSWSVQSDKTEHGRNENWMQSAGFITVLFIYSLARTFIVVEAFISLRRLPVDAYKIPDWAVWWPNFGSA